MFIERKRKRSAPTHTEKSKKQRDNTKRNQKL